MALLEVTNEAVSTLIDYEIILEAYERERVIVSFPSCNISRRASKACTKERKRVLTERFVNGQSKYVKSHKVQSHNEE